MIEFFSPRRCLAYDCGHRCYCCGSWFCSHCLDPNVVFHSHCFGLCLVKYRDGLWNYLFDGVSLVISIVGLMFVILLGVFYR